MTIYEYALFRHAFGLMWPDEKVRAGKLVKRADAGDKQAYQRFRELVASVILEASR